MIIKVVGYIVAVVGIIGLALATVPPLRAFFSLPVGFSGNALTSISLLIVIVGAVLVYLAGGGKTKKGTEVPIYEGKKVVGYRRI